MSLRRSLDVNSGLMATRGRIDNLFWMRKIAFSYVKAGLKRVLAMYIVVAYSSLQHLWPTEPPVEEHHI